MTHEEVILFMLENEYWIIKRDNLLTKELSNIISNKKYVQGFMNSALNSKSEKAITAAVTMYWLCYERIDLEKEFNKLIISPYHKSHQTLIKHLQDKLKYPSSVNYIKIALTSNFDYLQYTYSEDGVIAKWFSHALLAINTKASIDLIKEFTQSENLEINEEMKYRLSKITTSN
ncbi:hypothetical protein GCM10022393_29710 [Aquimarina addita]|uniref:Adenylosuccinate lyase n=1 Tax=Aquimarina addita TaxID=870485 RepID=A0ABP6UN15_9FLAO